MTRPTTTRVRAGVAAALATLVLGGCGATDALVGLHPAPTEKASAAPLDEEGATAIAARLVGEARAAATAKGAAGDAKRAEVLSGDALLVANAAAARGTAKAASPEIGTDEQPQVVAQSRGREWPRAILATTLDTASSTQYLHVMVSPAPTARFRIVESVPMFGGARLPAIGGPGGQGAPFVKVTDGEGLQTPPDKALAAYAAALGYPTSKTSATVSADDAFATALKASAAAQAKSLGALGGLSQVHVPALKSAVAFRLADGGVVTFGVLVRTDTITVKSGAKEIVLPTEYARVVGKTKITKAVTLKNYEPVVLVQPADGPATAIGATELLVSGSGR